MGEEYVSLADITYEPYLSRYIAFDAVKWEPRDAATWQSPGYQHQAHLEDNQLFRP